MSSGRSRRLADGVRAACEALGVCYATALLAYTLPGPRWGRRLGWRELIDDFAPWWFAPAPAMALAGLWLGSTALTAAGVAALATFGRTWWPVLVSRRRCASDDWATLTVMTFNVLAWNCDSDALAAAIRDGDAEVVALQELSPKLAEALTRELADRFPHRALRPADDTSGSGILSRWPLRDVTEFRLSESGHWCHCAVVEAATGPLTLFSIRVPIPHRPRPELPRRPRLAVPTRFDPERRRGEVRRLLEMIRATDGPLVVAGDFNMTEYSPDYRLVRTHLGDAFRTAGRGFGHTFPRLGSLPRAFPAPWPMLRLDYIWHSPELRPISARVGRSGGSDHHPVIVRFAVS